MLCLVAKICFKTSELLKIATEPQWILASAVRRLLGAQDDFKNNFLQYVIENINFNCDTPFLICNLKVRLKSQVENWYF